MASSKNSNDPGEKELLDIVLDMMIKNESKEEILKTLQETGLSKEEAKQVHEKAKKEYDERIESKLSKRVEELFKEHKENMLTRINSKLQDMKDSIETKQDLKATEQKKYVDDRIKNLKGEIEDVENQLFSLRSTEKSDYEEIDHRLSRIQPSSENKRTLSFVLILIGAIIITYSILNFQGTATLLGKDLSKAMIGVSLEALLIVTGLISIKFAKDMYISSKEEEVEEGRDQTWITE